MLNLKIFMNCVKRKGWNTENQIWPCEIPVRKSRPAACFLYLKHLIVMPRPESNYNGNSLTLTERRFPKSSDVCTCRVLTITIYINLFLILLKVY